MHILLYFDLITPYGVQMQTDQNGVLGGNYDLVEKMLIRGEAPYSSFPPRLYCGLLAFVLNTCTVVGGDSRNNFGFTDE